jgi:hypothetical protein
MLQGLESKQLIFELLSTDDFLSRSHRYGSGTIYALHAARGSNAEMNTKLKRLHKSWTASCPLPE